MVNHAIRRRTLFTLAILFGSAAAPAQNPGAITGTVFDLDGDPVARIPVQAIDAAGKPVLQAVSSDRGNYTLAGLPAGTYELSVTAPGFNNFSRKNVDLNAGQTVHLDIHLLDYQLNTLGDGREFRIDLVSPHQAPAGPAPRTRDGKPDFTGVWYAQRPVDPGKAEPLPWAAKLLQERAANNSKDAPGARCLTRGITNAGALFPYELIQTPTRLVMLFEDDIPSHREVYLDGRPHPKDPNPDWMGHSIGRWEGETLVIDTVGFNDRTWLDAAGHPHTEKMHVIEHLRRPDLGHLEIEFTIDDPGAYAKPWVIRRAADLDPGDEIGEYVCTEGERDVVHMVGK